MSSLTEGHVLVVGQCGHWWTEGQPDDFDLAAAVSRTCFGGGQEAHETDVAYLSWAYADGTTPAPRTAAVDGLGSVVIEEQPTGRLMVYFANDRRRLAAERWR